MGSLSPLDLLWITIAVAAVYAALAWRFFVVPAHRRHSVAPIAVTRQTRPTLQPNVRPQLQLVHGATARR